MIIPNLAVTAAVASTMSSVATTNSILRRSLVGRFGGAILQSGSGNTVLEIDRYDSTDGSNAKIAELVRFIKLNQENAEYASDIGGDTGVTLKVGEVTFELTQCSHNRYLNELTIYDEGCKIAKVKGFFDEETKVLWDEVLGTLKSKKEAEEKQRDKDKVDVFCFLVDEALKPKEKTTSATETGGDKKPRAGVGFMLSLFLFSGVFTLSFILGYWWIGLLVALIGIVLMALSI